MHDRRNSPRYGVKIEGKLMSPDMSCCVDVVIRNLSEDGALVSALATPGLIPERMYLWQAQTRTLFECKVQWRKNDRLLGLCFTDTSNRARRRAIIDAAMAVSGQAQPRVSGPAVPIHCVSSAA